MVCSSTEARPSGAFEVRSSTSRSGKTGEQTGNDAANPRIPWASKRSDFGMPMTHPAHFVDVQSSSTVPSRTVVVDGMSDFWSDQERIAHTSTTSEPLAHIPEKSRSFHGISIVTGDLQGQTEAISSLSSLSSPTSGSVFPETITSLATVSLTAEPSLSLGPVKESIDPVPVPSKDDRSESRQGGIEPTRSLGTAASCNGTPYVSSPPTSSILRTALPLLQNQQFIRMPRAGPNPLASTLARDALLTYAHQLFKSPFNPAPLSTATLPGISFVISEDPASPHHQYRSQLLPLLQKMKLLHPQHLPTLLLLGCVHFAVGDYQESLTQNEEILSLNGNFVEAMSNLGTTLKAMGRIKDAESWWWKAISLRPAYWDAVYNLLGILIAPEEGHDEAKPIRRHADALRLCDHVKRSLVDNDGKLLTEIPPNELYRFQNILYVYGNIQLLYDNASVCDCMPVFVTAINLLHRIVTPTETSVFTFKHLILAGCISGLALTSALPQSIAALASTMGFDGLSTGSVTMGCDVLRFVQLSGRDVHEQLLRDSGGVLPVIFLEPERAAELASHTFASYLGTFPALCRYSELNECLEGPSETVDRETKMTTANILLSVAKMLQEVDSPLGKSLPGLDEEMSISPSLILLLYYLAYSLSPSPSACNNIGILLSMIPWPKAPIARSEGRDGMSASELAQAYYESGLRLDGENQHLLTNLGSLRKEMGHVESAIDLYREAVRIRPDFDIALANLANALKDSGHLTESISYYRRALQSSPTLPEAVCGMVHAVWSICDWRGLGRIESNVTIDYDGHILHENVDDGWMPELVKINQKQLHAAYRLNLGIVRATGSISDWIGWIEASLGLQMSELSKKRWSTRLERYFTNSDHEQDQINEGGFMIRVIEWLTRLLQWRWYIDAFGPTLSSLQEFSPLFMNIPADKKRRFRRPFIPSMMSLLPVPSVLPFHTFIYPFSARELRLVAHRNALRVAHTTLTRSWLPEHVYPPPCPPQLRINIGYVSSDFNDHPTAHLIQSVFAMHDRSRFCIFVYALSMSDGSAYRRRIQDDSEFFRDVSSWSTQSIVERIIQDGIHILVNLNGYTKGARNDIFAARPCAVQISFLGFAGTLAAGWCDYMICDAIACPPHMRACELCETHSGQADMEAVSPGESEDVEFDIGPDPESIDGWKYAEKLIYMPHTYIVTDHKQAYGGSLLSSGTGALEYEWAELETRRRQLRSYLFPDISANVVVFANFNQSYKIDPSIFAAWLRILRRVPNSILWLLHFPPASEKHLRRTAKQLEDEQIASRIRFTDVATKSEHINRVCVADVFLDTAECNAHTIAADVLWSAVPIVTWPKYDFKMCSRVGASIANATGFGSQMVVNSLSAYEERALTLALSVRPSSISRTRTAGREPDGELANLRRNLFINRNTMPLFDTLRWTRNLEKGLEEAWKRWVQGGTFLHFKTGDEHNHRYGNCSGFIWIRDEG